METQKATATQPPTSPIAAGERAVQPARRWYYLDWLRVLAILSVFLYHDAKIFDYDSTGSMISNTQRDWGMTLFARILELWGMPLFFVLAAVAIFFSLTSRDNQHFLAERFKRLFIPYLGGVFLLGPPFVYIERITHAQFTGSFWQFLPHYFDGWYGFGGNFVWTGLHLWFLFLLFLFSLMLLPLFRYLKQANIAPVVLHKFPWLRGELFLVVPIVCTAILEALANLQPDGVGSRFFGGWSPVSYLGFFLCGYLLALNQEALGSFQRNRTRTLLLGVCTTLLYLVLVYGYHSSSYTILFSLLRALNAWLWLATILGFARRYLNVDNPLRARANQAVLPFYILHIPVLFAIAFFLITWNIPILAKFLLIALVSFVIILGLYQGVIVRVPFLRFLFGMKAREKRTLQVAPS
jgi:glucan biosynthesis protein C